MNFTSIKLIIGIILALFVISDANDHSKGSSHSKGKDVHVRGKTKLSSKSSKLALAPLSELTRNFKPRADEKQVKVEKSMKKDSHHNKRLEKKDHKNHKELKEKKNRANLESNKNLEEESDPKQIKSTKSHIKSKDHNKEMFSHKSSNNVFDYKHIETKPLTTVYSTGYGYQEVYSGVDCTGEITLIAGNLLGSCLIGFNGNISLSYEVTCSSTDAILNVYSDNSCDSKTFQYSVSYPLGGCTNNATAFSPLGVSYSTQCTTSTTDLPVTGTYIVFDAFYNDTDYTCSGSPVLFNAYLQDYCFVESSDASFKFGCNTYYGPTEVYYYESNTCKGYHYYSTGYNDYCALLYYYDTFEYYSSFCYNSDNEISYDDISYSYTYNYTYDDNYYYDDYYNYTFDDNFYYDDNYYYGGQLTGYYYETYYSDADCSGELTLNRGIALDKCLTVYNVDGSTQGSMLFSCFDDEVYYYEYSEIGCQGSYEFYYYSTDTCVNEDTTYGKSYSSSCSSSLSPPVDFESILVQGYEGYDAFYCDTEVTQYAAYSPNYCYKFENDLSSSYLLNCTVDYGYDYITEYDYYNSDTCSYESVPLGYYSDSCYYFDYAIPFDYNSLSTTSEEKAVSSKPQGKTNLLDSKQLKMRNRNNLKKNKKSNRSLSKDELSFSKSFQSVATVVPNNNLRSTDKPLASSVPTGYAQTISFDTYGYFGQCEYKEAVSGVAVGICLVNYDNDVAISSLLYSCSNGQIYEYAYSDTSCSGTYTTTAVKINECNGYNSETAYKYQCTSGTTIPTEYYSAMTLFYDEADETCDVYPISYSYYPEYTCVNDYATNTSYYVYCTVYDYYIYPATYEPFVYNYSSLDCYDYIDSGFINATCAVNEYTGSTYEAYYTRKCAVPGEYYFGDDEFTFYSYYNDNYYYNDTYYYDDNYYDDYVSPPSNDTIYLYYLFDVECYTPTPTTKIPTLSPILKPTLTPVLIPTFSPVSGPTATPYSNVAVAQVINGVGYANYTKNTTAYILSIEQSIVYSINYITTENIYALAVIPPSTNVANAKSYSTVPVPSSYYTSLSIYYEIISTSSYVTDELIISQLNYSVSSGDFTTYLNQAAIQYGAPGLQDASTDSISTSSIQFPTSQPASSPGSNGLSPGLIALTVILVVFGVAAISFTTYYFLFLSKQQTTPATTTTTTTTAPEPEISTKQVDIQLPETHATTENPMATKSNVFGAANKDKTTDTTIGVKSEEAVKAEPSAPPATTEE
mmetsp:Transcript_19954/g.18126  ORF Transcript_19954/g.18126 Transcript_19954/m.18126 type:complete len:1247 (+) Transcript_19954:100-3840(+)